MRRQHAAIAATATALCLGGLVAACAGGTAHHGYAAVGAAGAGRALTTPVPPSGKVTLTPLDGPGAAAGHGGGPTAPGAGDSASGEGTQGSSAPGGANSGHQQPSTGGAGSPGTSRTPGGPAGTAAPGGSSGSGTSAPPKSGAGGSTSPSPGGSGGTSPSPSAGPAVLKAGAPDRAAADKRWCEKVTVRFSNTGGSPVASGTVTFSTHIIGGLGVDWATRTSKQPLPAPIAAGAATSKTYTVCVDDWRVPLGMHIETRKISVSWK